MPIACAAVVATRNRPDSLGRLLGSLLGQTQRPRQVVVVDDGQLPDAWIADWSARYRVADMELVYRRKSRPGRSASRNMGVELADADAVCFFDDDCEPAADFLAMLCDAMQRSGAVALEGNVQPAGGELPGHRAYRQLLRHVGWWRLAPLSRPRADGVAPARTLCGVALVRRDAMRAEPFDASLSHGEDYEVSVRLAWMGPIGRVEGAGCIHHLDAQGRPGQFGLGVRIARNYLRAQSKLFGWKGRLLAPLSVIGLSLGETAFAVAAWLRLRRGGGAHLARAGGLLAGVLTPWGRRADA